MSAEKQIPILATWDTEHIKKTAEQLQVNIPEPMTVHDLLQGKERGKKIETVLVDDAEYVLGTFVRNVCGAQIEAMSITP